MTQNININNSNFQNGNYNTFIDSSNLNKVNWKNIERDYLKIKEIEKTIELVDAIKWQLVASFKEKIKKHNSDYEINLSTTAILKIVNMFL